jgi:hypothetical protein
MKTTANNRISTIAITLALVFSAGSATAATVLANWNDSERIAPRSVLPEGQLDDIAPNSQAGVILASWNDGERIAPRSVLPEGQHRGLLV